MPITLVYRLRSWHRERHLWRQLAAIDRVVEWNKIEPKFRVGAGTLVFEHCSLKGPVRDWWTEEDVIGSAPLPLPVSLTLPLEVGRADQLHEYAKACATKYLDLKSGVAKLTAVPSVLLIDGKLAKEIPLGKAVTLINWGKNPELIVGDPNTVFMAPVQ